MSNFELPVSVAHRLEVLADKCGGGRYIFDELTNETSFKHILKVLVGDAFVIEPEQPLSWLWHGEVNLGHANYTQLLPELEKKGVFVTEWARDLILNGAYFLPAISEKRHNFYSVSGEGLGFRRPSDKRVTRTQIERRGLALGLELCPVQAPIVFLLQYLTKRTVLDLFNNVLTPLHVATTTRKDDTHEEALLIQWEDGKMVLHSELVEVEQTYCTSQQWLFVQEVREPTVLISPNG